MKCALLDAFAADSVVADRPYEPPVVQWRDIAYEKPAGRIVLLKTGHGMYVHPMCDKQGVVRSWDEQQDRWTGGKYDYADVTHWVRLA